MIIKYQNFPMIKLNSNNIFHTNEYYLLKISNHDFAGGLLPDWCNSKAS